jgi:hypothetical protein
MGYNRLCLPFREQNSRCEGQKMSRSIDNMKPVLTALIGKVDTDLIFAVNEIAGYQLSDEQREPFLSFWKFCNDPVPEFIKKWRQNPVDEEKYYLRVCGGIGDNTSCAYDAVHYHHQHLTDIEKQLLELFSKYDFESVPKSSAKVMGDTKKWTFEYHAFVFAYRRTLDYFTYALNGYFKQDGASFHEWKKQLSRLRERRKDPVASGLLAVYEKYRDKFDFVVSDGVRKHKSTRDRIAHEQFVGTPAINITRRGLIYAGGGEHFGFDKVQGQPLSQILQTRINDLKNYLSESVAVFSATAR